MRQDEAQLDRIAADLERELLPRARAARPAKGVARVVRAVERLRQGLTRGFRRLLREHWDVGFFDALFGALKAFGVYPALYMAGLAWTIPLMEYAPLNTQLWTAGYLFVRDKLLSGLGRLRYGYSLRRLDALRGAHLPSVPNGTTRHPLVDAPGGPCVHIRRSRVAAAWERLRGHAPAAGVLDQGRLRELVADPGFVHVANPLRSNPWLYERVLLRHALADASARERLLEIAITDDVPADAAAVELLERSDELTRARLEADRDRLRTVLRALRPVAGAACAAGLSWLLASHRRAVRRAQSGLRHARYQLLADLAGGGTLDEPARVEPVRAARAALRARIACASALVDRIEAASRGREPAEASAQLLAQALAEARASGISARRAGLAAEHVGRSAPLRIPAPACRMPS